MGKSVSFKTSTADLTASCRPPRASFTSHTTPITVSRADASLSGSCSALSFAARFRGLRRPLTVPRRRESSLPGLTEEPLLADEPPASEVGEPGRADELSSLRCERGTRPGDDALRCSGCNVAPSLPIDMPAIGR